MEWTQIGPIIGASASVISIIGFLIFLLNSRFTQVDDDIKDVRNDIKELRDDMKSWTQHIVAMQAEQSKRMDMANVRMDQLYNMFYDVVKKSR